MQKFHVIGTGPGAREYLPPAAIDAIREAEVLFGGGKIISGYRELGRSKELVPLSGSVAPFLNRLDSRRRTANCAVLVSGDPGFYSLLAAVRRRFEPVDFTVIPGITAFQLACAKLGLNWQDFRLGSAHGKSLESMLSRLSPEQGAVILTDRKNTPAVIGRYLIYHGWQDRNGWICEDISGADEEIEPVTLSTISDEKEYRICLMILLPSCAE